MSNEACVGIVYLNRCCTKHIQKIYKIKEKLYNLIGIEKPR